jgi:hypothetical protein
MNNDYDPIKPITETIGITTVSGSGNKAGRASLELYQSSGVDDGAFYPATSLTIYGTTQITKLRDFCTTLLEATKVEPKP